MAITKTGYKQKYVSNTDVKVNVNADGNFAQSGETVAGQKRYTLKGANIENSLSANTEILGAFLGIVGAGQDSLSNRASVTWEAI